MAAFLQFTLGSLSNVDLGVTLLDKVKRPIIAAAKEKIEQVPGLAGVWWYGADLGMKIFVLPCEFVETTTRAQLQAAARVLSAHLLDAFGEPEKLALSFTDEAAVFYDVYWYKKLDIKRLVTTGTFNLQLACPDAFGYGAEDTDSAAITASPQPITVVNAGDVPAPMVIVITNNGGAPINGFTLTRELEV